MQGLEVNCGRHSPRFPRRRADQRNSAITDLARHALTLAHSRARSVREGLWRTLLGFVVHAKWMGTGCRSCRALFDSLRSLVSIAVGTARVIACLLAASHVLRSRRDSSVRQRAI